MWRRDRVAKRSLYMDGGIPEYWIVDGDKREIIICRPGETDRIVQDRLMWRPKGSASSLEIDLAALF